MHRTIVAALGFLLVVGFAATSAAWKGELAGAVQSIAEVQANAEAGDYVVVEGRVAEVRAGHGSVMIVIFEDESGSLPLRVPNHLLRSFAGATDQGGSGPTGATPTIGNRARVGGRCDHEHMNQDTWGIHVQRVEPLGD